MSWPGHFGWTLVRRPAGGLASLAAAFTLAALATGLIGGLLFLAAGAAPAQAFAALAKGAFGSWRAVSETLVKATPLIFTGLATALAFRARLWNIGAEGQVFAGAIVAYGCSLQLAGLSPWLQVPALLTAAMLGGALYGALAGLLKVLGRVDEVISTVMLNYIIVFGLSLLLLHGPWSEAGGFFEQSAKIDPGAALPKLVTGLRVHLGFVLALLMAVLVGFLIERTPLGFEIRAAGSNLRALAFQGARIGRLILVVMALSGALAGLAGASELLGVQQRLKAGTLVGYGYTGIIIAILGQLRPLGIVLAALLFGALVNGATLMQIQTGVPSALIYALQAIVLLAFLIARAATGWRLRRLAHAG